jgi:hypothetical protein
VQEQQDAGECDQHCVFCTTGSTKTTNGDQGQ